MVEIRPADSSRLAHIAEVVGRVFVTEPVMAWPLGGRTDHLEERCIRYHALFLEPLMGRGIIWESMMDTVPSCWWRPNNGTR